MGVIMKKEAKKERYIASLKITDSNGNIIEKGQILDSAPNLDKKIIEKYFTKG
jgi:hypothetical protein